VLIVPVLVLVPVLPVRVLVLVTSQVPMVPKFCPNIVRAKRVVVVVVLTAVLV
jgi:hypothetical protein